jgi:hypothetical protein
MRQIAFGSLSDMVQSGRPGAALQCRGAIRNVIAAKGPDAARNFFKSPGIAEILSPYFIFSADI